MAENSKSKNDEYFMRQAIKEARPSEIKSVFEKDIVSS